MRINIYDEDLNLVEPIGDNYISCLWTEGYNTVESFTLELIAKESYVKKIKPDMYVKRIDRTNVMVIKTIELKGDSLVISGKQAVAVLDDVAFVGKIDAGQPIDTLLVNAYNNSNKYPNVNVIGGGISDAYEHQISNKSVFEICDLVCQERDVGFVASKVDKRIEISVYKPENEPVRFSSFFGNLKFSSSINSFENFKNYAIILGEGEDENRKKAYLDLSNGGKRREVIIDAKDLRQEEEETEEDYIKRLVARGAEKLLEKTKVFSVDVVNLPKGWGIDYDLGHKVLIVIPEQGLKYETRVVKFQEKSQQGIDEVVVTFGELIRLR